MRCQWCSVYIQTDRNSGRNLLCCCSCDHTHHSDPYTRQCLHKTHTLQSKQNASVIAHLAAIKMKSSHIFNTSCTFSPNNNSSSRNTYPKEITSIVTFYQHIYISTRVYSSLISMAPSAAGLSVLKAMALNNATSSYCIKVWCSCSVTDYGLGLTKLDRVQNEAMRIIVGTSKDTTTEARRFILDLLPMQTRQKVNRSKHTSELQKIPTTHFFLVSSYHTCCLILTELVRWE